MENIIVRGFSKVGKIIQDDPADSVFVVEFEKVRVIVDKKTKNIVLPKNCVVIQD